MRRQWYLIDDEGIHPVDSGGDSDDFWEPFDGDDGEAPWPAFNQTVVAASPTRTVEGLQDTAPHMDVRLEEVTDDPARWDRGLVVARAGELTAVAEPDVELDERVMALSWTEELMEQLRCDGAFFGYDPAAKTLHLAVFSQGAVCFAWSDSLVPGPSYAMVFEEDGQCTDEDPRRFALRRLDMPETSPLLDRYQFVEAELGRLGLETISPDLSEFPISAVLRADIRRSVGKKEP